MNMGNINRLNYETFFLLYTDNELSVEERKAVEEFVDANPDLQEELVMLQQSILKPDDIVFADKQSLLKIGSIPTGIQEKLLLLLDHELTVTEENELTGLINTSADVKMEWEILQQTKQLRDEAIMFPDKQLLYRKEGGRVVAFPWRQLAAASVLIAFGIWGGAVYFNNRNTNTGDAGMVKNIELKKPVGNRVKPVVIPEPARVPVGPFVGEQELAKAPDDIKKRLAPEAATLHSPKKLVAGRLAKDKIQPLVVIEKNNNLPKPYSHNLNKIESNENVPAYVTSQKQSSDIEDPGNNATGKNTGSVAAAKVYAAYYPDNSEDDNNNRILFMDEEKIKKTRLGGIFRKVKRVLERQANIKPGGNNIKVANLEFAIQ